MPKSILNIISTSYRATLEEQDDTIVWLVHTMKANGANTDLILRGSCVNYAITQSIPEGLQIGDWKQKNPPDLSSDLRKLHDKGAKIYYLEEDAAHLGLERHQFMSFMNSISEKQIAVLCTNYDYVWHW